MAAVKAGRAGMRGVAGVVLGASVNLVPKGVLLRVNRHPALRRRLRALVDGAARATGPRGVQAVKMTRGPLAGLTLELDFSNDGERAVWLDTYEPWVQRQAVSMARPGLTVWDVGAYVGAYAMLFRRAGCTVVALEPDPANRSRLEKNLSRNGMDDVAVLPYAVAAAPGSISFSPAAMHGRAGAGGSLSVEAVTLDSLARRFGRPDVVLMDVQGAEADALSGSTRLLNEFRPIWIVELHGAEGVRAAEHLAAAGYRLTTPDPSATAAQLLSRERRTHVLAVP